LAKQLNSNKFISK